MVGNKGFEINSAAGIRKDAFLFGEAQSRVLVSVSADKTKALETELTKHGVKFSVLGSVKGKSVVVDGTNYGDLKEYQTAYETSIEGYMN
jgi:phosphoribosylformylglycinamidine synthase